MKILLAPDKFKGSLSALDVCEAIASGLRKKDDTLEFIFHPMADGGDDSISILNNYLSLEKEVVTTSDPMGRPITANYFTSSDAAFIEVASASGLVLLEKRERNPMETSTLGTGKIVVDALQKGYKHIYLFLGGSATNDAGTGIAQALGFQFFDKENKILHPAGKNLSKIKSIKNRHLFNFNNISITIFYDVVNPLFGRTGAAYVYAPQKGASPDEVQYLDAGLVHYSAVLQEHTGVNVSIIPGGGSAGGIGAGLVALCGAKMEKGFDVMARLTNLEEKIQQADLVISGEGRLDEQSLQGKVVDGIAYLCLKYQKPLALFVGKNELSEKALLDLNLGQVFSISEVAKNIDDAMNNGALYLKGLAEGFDFGKV